MSQVAEALQSLRSLLAELGEDPNGRVTKLEDAVADYVRNYLVPGRRLDPEAA